MAKKAKSGVLSALIHVVLWIVGLLVALAVGFGMIGETLTVPYVQPIVPVAGWIVVILTLLGALMAIVNALQ